MSSNQNKLMLKQQGPPQLEPSEGPDIVCDKVFVVHVEQTMLV